eukprot:TRINITY_DN3988_c0_g2_i1.p1 TRINITY_DN3988_c0_g2~~TRINITY_DN3988_c0_g2_i1.p1  ORF type:complete len:752 (+),score=150.20 TRINITY_DN3988_c0_g2_i1:264-2258(+)
MASADKYRVQVADAVPASAGCVSKGPAYRNILSKDGFPKLDKATTCWEVLNAGVSKYPKNNFLGRRTKVDGKAGPYEWISYEEALALSLQVGSALRFVGLKKDTPVGIYGINSPEWVISMEGINSQSMKCVPLYDTLGADAIDFILKHAETEAVFVQPAKAATLVRALVKAKNSVKVVVSFGEWDAEQKTSLEQQKLQVFTWTQFLGLGKTTPVDAVPPTPEDICTIMYTSGTTGEPKGVLLTHRAVVGQIAGLRTYIEAVGIPVDCNDAHLSYLPLSHIMERAAMEFFSYNGAQIGFWQGDVKLLSEDIAELKPTIFAGVPRIFDRIYSGVKAKVDSTKGLPNFLFNFFYDRKVSAIREGKAHDKSGPIADAIVFGKVKARLGGRNRLILSGAAPLAPHVEEFLKVAFCAPVVQAYGLTETSSGGFIAHPNTISQAGTVGPPVPSVEIRLESVPEMNYDALGTPARGELCIKGDVLFSGYYKRPDLTKEAIDADGWFHTGDVGEWQADGSMKIIDRKKNIFKLSQGEYVAVENLENVFGNCKAVESVWVYGNSFEPTLVAVANPSQEGLLKWAAENNVSGSYEEVCATEEAKKYILSELTAVGKSAKLNGFEMIRAIHLDPVPFDIERDLLTPTFKKKRPQLLKYYKAHIDAMYDKLRAASSA